MTTDRNSKEANKVFQGVGCTFCDLMVPHGDKPCTATPPATIPAAEVLALVERTDELLHNIEGWGKAYPTDIFHEPTKEERDWLHATRPGLMDCIAASMGRHVWSHIEKDVAAIRDELAKLIPRGK